MLVLSSDHEGFPNVVMEAMAARLPVVSTPAGDAGVLVDDGRTGFVVPFDDANAMADRMVRLARSSDLRRQFGEAGRARVEHHHAYDRLITHLLRTYRAIASQRGDANLLRRVATLERDNVPPAVIGLSENELRSNAARRFSFLPTPAHQE